MNLNGILPFKVRHQRKYPFVYDFTHQFFWFKIDLLNNQKWPSFLFSRNKFNLYSLFDSDHVDFGKSSMQNNFMEFLLLNGVDEKMKSLVIYTQVRFMGYVFNPVSFVLAEGESGKRYGIIEIGNTFNEIKPYFVSPDCFENENFKLSVIKNFYISPFIDLEHTMEFSFNKKEKGISIHINDNKEGKSVLEVWFRGVEEAASTHNLLRETIKVPFVTMKIIFLIHWHAFILWARKVPYFKKEENPDLQQGKMIWKK